MKTVIKLFTIFALLILPQLSIGQNPPTLKPDSSLFKKFQADPISMKDLGDDMVELNDNLQIAQHAVDSLKTQLSRIQTNLAQVRIFAAEHERNTNRVKMVGVALNSIGSALEKPQGTDRDYAISALEKQIIRTLSPLSEPDFYEDETSPLTTLKRTARAQFDAITLQSGYYQMSATYADFFTSSIYCKSQIELDGLRKELNDSLLIPAALRSMTIVNQEIVNLEFNASVVEKRIGEYQLQAKEIRNTISDQDGDINTLAIMLGLPLFSLTILTLFLAPLFLRFLARRSKSKSAKHTGVSQTTTLEISTVFLVTMTILILGLARILNHEILGTLLGAIAGYVLNSARKAAGDADKRRGTFSEENNTPPPTNAAP